MQVVNEKGGFKMEFTVKVINGEVFINNEYVEQLCWDADAIGNAVANWINEQEKED